MMAVIRPIIVTTVRAMVEISYSGNNLTKVFFYTTRSAATYTPIPYDSSGEIIFSLSYNTK